MEPFEPFVDGFYDVEGQLWRHVRERAEALFEREREAKAAIDSVAAFEERRARLEVGFRGSIGGLPGGDELNPVRTGTIEREGYDVETVVFESLPGFHVTANCYLPHGEGPHPGVLFLCGHADAAKAYPPYQKVCIQLARSGFVVLAVDPMGQGERYQYYDPEAGEPTVEPGTTEHAYAAWPLVFAGANVARYFVRDAMAGLDYLESRPEVDGDRLGVTGNSGGGTQTAFLLMCDDRVDAAVPCTCQHFGLREVFMTTSGTADGEQNVRGAIEMGLDGDDYLTAIAPKPVRLGAVRSDFVPIEGILGAYERAEAVYERYDAPENLDLALFEGIHGYTDDLRDAATEWFVTHLRGPDAEAWTGAIDVEDAATLRCTEAGQIVAARPDGRTVDDLTAAYVRERHGSEQTADVDPDEVRGAVVDRLDLDRPRVELHPRIVASDREGGFVSEKVFFRSEPGIVVTGVLVRPEKPVEDPTAMVALFEDGTEEIPTRRARIEALAAEHGLAFVFDPRGRGAVRSRHLTPASRDGGYDGFFGTEYKLAYDAVQMGTSLLGMRVFDVLRAHDFLRERTGGAVGVYGCDVGALYALYAAVVEPGLDAVRVEDVPPSFRDRATTRKGEIDHRATTYDVVGECDVPHREAALADRDFERCD